MGATPTIQSNLRSLGACAGVVHPDRHLDISKCLQHTDVSMLFKQSA